MKVCSVVVTYGDRFHYVEKVMRALVSEGIDKVILVSNGTINNTFEKLISLKTEHPMPIEIIYSEKNRGSAYGFKVGIEQAIKDKSIEYIWLLDDDNKPNPGALAALKVHWMNKLPPDQEKWKNFALLSHRSDRPLFKEAVFRKQPRLMLGPTNSFLGFHFLEILKRIKLKFDARTRFNFTNNAFGKVAVAPYGGLFFHKDLIAKIGLPDVTYFLYADDYDFSYRITKSGGDIILITSSEVHDLETSFHLKKDNNKSNRFFKTNSELRIFYSVRNGIRFESENFVSNTFVYKLNMAFYLVILFLLFCTRPSEFNKFKLIISAIKAAFKKDFSEI